jgi:uncharacterized protein (UPF0335 family)
VSETTQSTEGFSATDLRGYIDRLNRLLEEKKQIAESEKEVLAEAASTGFDKKLLKTVVKIMNSDNEARLDNESKLDVYLRALGIDNTPPGE